MKRNLILVLGLFLAMNCFGLNYKNGKANNLYYLNNQANYVKPMKEITTKGDFGVGFAHTKHWVYGYLRENDQYVFFKIEHSDLRIRDKKNVFTVVVDNYGYAIKNWTIPILTGGFFNLYNSIENFVIANTTTQESNEELNDLVIKFGLQLDSIPAEKMYRAKNRLERIMGEVAEISLETYNYQCDYEKFEILEK